MRVCNRCRGEFAGPAWSCPACGKCPDTVDGVTLLAPGKTDSSTGYKADYFAQLAPLEEGNFWFRTRNRLIINALSRYFPRAENMLEIGCGTGFVLSAVERAFPNLNLTGGDIHAAGLAFAAQRVQEAGLLQLDASDLPFRDEFDVIGAFDVLEHIEDDTGVLVQMRQALRKDGGIILTVPYHQFLWSKNDECACHMRRYGIADIRAKLTETGFKEVRSTSFVALLLPLMVISRYARQWGKDEFDVMDELRLGKMTNKVLERCMDLERMIIRAGVNFPFGGSLLLVAQRN